MNIKLKITSITTCLVTQSKGITTHFRLTSNAIILATACNVYLTGLDRGTGGLSCFFASSSIMFGSFTFPSFSFRKSFCFVFSHHFLWTSIFVSFSLHTVLVLSIFLRLFPFLVFTFSLSSSLFFFLVSSSSFHSLSLPFLSALHSSCIFSLF